MEVLRARVAQLEAENAALAAAGEEAAALAEHYARAEARARRRARADAELERVLRAQLQIATAHSAPACACPAPNDNRNATLLDALVAVVRAAAPQNADKVANATLAAVALHAAHEYLARAAKIALGGAAKVVVDAQRAVNRAQGSKNVSQSDLEQFEALARQARCFASALRDNASGDVLVLHCALLRSATTAISNTPAVSSSVKCRAVATTLADELRSLVTAERTLTKPIPESPPQSIPKELKEPKSPLIVSENASNRIAELEKKLEDECVRSAVFEAKLAGVHRTEATVDTLRDQLTKREQEIAHAQAETERVREDYAREQAEAAPKVAAQAHAAARLHVADEHARRVRALNAHAASLLVADLQEAQETSGLPRKRVTVCRKRLRAARLAAARVEVVRLDANTLLPVTGANSTKTIGANA